jgi:hypothetical protein
MPPIHATILEARALVLGTPIFMGQMSAQGKIFLDRLHPFFAPRFSPSFQERNAGKALVLAFIQGNPDPELFQVYVDYTCQMFRKLEFDVREPVMVTGTRSVAAQEQGGLEARLKAIGVSLASRAGLPGHRYPHQSIPPAASLSPNPDSRTDGFPAAKGTLPFSASSTTPLLARVRPV